VISDFFLGSLGLIKEVKYFGLPIFVDSFGSGAVGRADSSSRFLNASFPIHFASFRCQSSRAYAAAPTFGRHLSKRLSILFKISVKAIPVMAKIITLKLLWLLTTTTLPRSSDRAYLLNFRVDGTPMRERLLFNIGRF